MKLQGIWNAINVGGGALGCAACVSRQGPVVCGNRPRSQPAVRNHLYPQCRDRPRPPHGAVGAAAAAVGQCHGFAEAAGCAADLPIPHPQAEPCSAESFDIQAFHAKPSTFKRAEALQLRCVAMTPRHLFAGRSRGVRLPLSLWRRRRGRPHHLLRPPAPRGFELLPVAFSSDEPAGSRRGAGRTPQNSAAACGGGMSEDD